MTWINQIAIGTEYTFDELTLQGNAHLAFESRAESSARQFVIQKLIGEESQLYQRYGTLHTGPNQVVTIRQSMYYLPLNLYVYDQGSLSLPDRVMLHRTESVVNGLLGGARDLSLSHSMLSFGENSRSAVETIQTTFSFDTLSVLPGSVVELSGWSGDYELKLTRLEIGANGKVLGRRLKVRAEMITLAETAVLSVDYGGLNSNGIGMYYLAGKMKCRSRRLPHSVYTHLKGRVYVW